MTPLAPDRPAGERLQLASTPGVDRLPLRPWKLLIVDDEPEVHSVTRLALSDFRFNDRGLEFISAHSAAEAKLVAANDPEIAVMLLDVVMESDDAGLRVVEYVRQVLGNNFLRIILRTGHPGLAPERDIIKAYDINDYRAKTELTRDRMFSVMYTALAAYQRLITLAHSRRYLATLADEYRSVMSRMSQRINHPVDALEVVARRLGQRLKQHRDPAVQEDIAKVLDTCTQLRGLTSSLERLAGLSEPDDVPADVEMQQVFEQACERLDDLLKSRETQLTHSPLPVLRGHQGLLVDLFEHLLRNAIQFQPGPRPEVEVNVESSGKDWKFTVADRGRGVPVDRSQDIFQTFSRLAPDDSDDQAIGIGLTMCRKIVALHGGKIWVEPRPGGGSLFQFTLPAGGSPCEGPRS